MNQIMSRESPASDVKVGLKIVHYRNKINKQGKSPVMLRITTNGKQKYVSTTISIEERWWDKNNNRVKRSHPNANDFNKLINDKFIEVENQYYNVEPVAFEVIPVAEPVKIEVKPKEGRTMLTVEHVIKNEIDFLNKKKRFSSATILEHSFKLMNKRLTQQNIEALNSKWVDDYVEHISTNHNFKGNGVTIYLRSLKACFRKHYKDERHLISNYFNEYRLAVKTTRKRAISEDYIGKLVDLTFAFDPNANIKRGLGKRQIIEHLTSLERSRDLFLLSILLNGINFKDLALLRKTNLINGRIEWTRSKTKSLHSVKITPAIQMLLDKLKTNNEMLLPIISVKYARNQDNTAFEQYYKGRRKSHNERLNKIGKMIGLETSLTTYCGRHSFATLLNNSGVNINVIQQAMGHTDIKTTQIYLASLNNDVMDRANDKLCELIAF